MVYLLNFKKFMSRSFVSAPNSISETLSHKGWRQTMQEEIDALYRNHMRRLVSLPRGKEVAGCKWDFIVKNNPDSIVDRLQWLFVAKGYAKTFGINYFEIFSQVSKLNSVRIIIFIVANKNWSLYQLNVEDVSLHRNLHEKVYMQPPPEFVVRGEGNKVYFLKKSIYGSKQSLRVQSNCHQTWSSKL